MQGSKPNTSGVDLHGWNNKRGSKNGSLLTVSKKMSRKIKKMHVFLGFERFLLSNMEAEGRVVDPTPQVDPHGWNN